VGKFVLSSNDIQYSILGYAKEQLVEYIEREKISSYIMNDLLMTSKL